MSKRFKKVDHTYPDLFIDMAFKRGDGSVDMSPFFMGLVYPVLDFTPVGLGKLKVNSLRI